MKDLTTWTDEELNEELSRLRFRVEMANKKREELAKSKEDVRCSEQLNMLTGNLFRVVAIGKDIKEELEVRKLINLKVERVDGVIKQSLIHDV